ncbi:MAG: hypothetical protein WAX14_10950 [Rhodococcus sp. (in: high G+C Gram-positive bacteria)]|uniref:hypothetical protein n=1 Tax=Rhodococcus sp. TaxID=1831 RepID=UPI003BB6E989
MSTDTGAVIDEQSFRTIDEAAAWASTHPRAGSSIPILEEQVDGEWHELAGPGGE